MPETSVDKDRASPIGEDKIGRAGQFAVVKPIPVAKGMQQFADDHFGLGILRSDKRHPLAALVSRKRIHAVHFRLKSFIQMPDTTLLKVGELYSNAEIQDMLGVGNAGGVRLSMSGPDTVRRAVILTSVPTARQATENPYYDRIENGVLVYTGAGREGDQSLAGMNKRLPQQATDAFPIYGFILV